MVYLGFKHQGLGFKELQKRCVYNEVYLGFKHQGLGFKELQERCVYIWCTWGLSIRVEVLKKSRKHVCTCSVLGFHFWESGVFEVLRTSRIKYCLIQYFNITLESSIPLR